MRKFVVVVRFPLSYSACSIWNDYKVQGLNVGTIVDCNLSHNFKPGISILNDRRCPFEAIVGSSIEITLNFIERSFYL